MDILCSFVKILQRLLAVNLYQQVRRQSIAAVSAAGHLLLSSFPCVKDVLHHCLHCFSVVAFNSQCQDGVM